MKADEKQDSSLMRGMIVSCVIGLLVYAGMVAWADTDGVLQALKQLQLTHLLAALGLVLLGYGLRFLRWEIYRLRVGVRLGRGRSLLVFLSGLALTVSPGKLGEAFKCVLLKEETGIAVSTTAPIVLAERLTDLLSLLILVALANLGPQAEHAWILGVTLAGCLAFLCAIAYPPVTRLLLKLLGSIRPMARLAPKAENALERSRQLLAPRLLFPAVVLGMGAWALECAAAWGIATAIGPPDLTYSQVVAAFSLSLVAGAVALFAPGGLGITEGLYAGQIERIGRSYGATETVARAGAASATLITRLVTLWFAVLMGLVALSIHRRGRPSKPRPQTTP